VTAPPHVSIDRLYQAHCHRKGCGWTGELRVTVAAADTDRRLHLNDHIAEVKTQ